MHSHTRPRRWLAGWLAGWLAVLPAYLPTYLPTGRRERPMVKHVASRHYRTRGCWSKTISTTSIRSHGLIQLVVVTLVGQHTHGSASQHELAQGRPADRHDVQRTHDVQRSLSPRRPRTALAHHQIADCVPTRYSTLRSVQHSRCKHAHTHTSHSDCPTRQPRARIPVTIPTGNRSHSQNAGCTPLPGFLTTTLLASHIT